MTEAERLSDNRDVATPNELEHLNYALRAQIMRDIAVAFRTAAPRIERTPPNTGPR